MERWIAIGSLILGSVAFGVVLSIPDAPDSPLSHQVGGLMPAVRISEVPAPSIAAASQAKPGALIELPAVEVAASVDRIASSQVAPAPSRTREGAPRELNSTEATERCSPSREVGPKPANEGIGSAGQRVSELC